MWRTILRVGNIASKNYLKKDPEIIICSKYFGAKRGIETTTGYKDLKAIKEKRLFEIDNNLLDRQGPRLADGLDALSQTIAS